MEWLVLASTPSAGPQPSLPGVCIPGWGPSPPTCPVSPGPEMTWTPWSPAWSRMANFLHRGPCLGAGSWVEPTHVLRLSTWGFAQAGPRPGEQSGHRGPLPQGACRRSGTWTEAGAPRQAAGPQAAAPWPGAWSVCLPFCLCRPSHTWGHSLPACRQGDQSSPRPSSGFCLKK